MSTTEKRVEFLYRLGKLLTFAEESGIRIIVSTFYRTAEEQKKMFDKGLSMVDGITKVGSHQLWLAVDMYVVKDDGQLDFTPSAYTALGEKWEELGGNWGGRYEHLRDYGHFEY